MQNENNKANTGAYYKKLSLECMGLSGSGITVILLICIFGPGEIQYLSIPVFRVLLVMGVIVFIIGVVGFIISRHTKMDSK